MKLLAVLLGALVGACTFNTATSALIGDGAPSADGSRPDSAWDQADGAFADAPPAEPDAPPAEPDAQFDAAPAASPDAASAPERGS